MDLRGLRLAFADDPRFSGLRAFPRLLDSEGCMFFFCSIQVKRPEMNDEPANDGYALGLLVDLRDICRKIGDSHYRMAAELHDLLRKVANPDVHDLDKCRRLDRLAWRAR